MRLAHREALQGMAQERRAALGAGEHDRMSLDAKARRAGLVDAPQRVALPGGREPDLLRQSAFRRHSAGR